MKLLAAAFSAFARSWCKPKAAEPDDNCSDYAAELDERLALRKAHRLAERAMRG